MSESGSVENNTEPIRVSLTIRTSPAGYFFAFILILFLSAFMLYAGFYAAAALLFVLAWTIIPALIYTDRIKFDGRRLSRTGILPRTLCKLGLIRDRLKLSDIEQVDTQAIRTLKRGGKVFYRYRTAFRGKGAAMVIVSGGDAFRKIVPAILSRLPADVLDNRSIELRDYLAAPHEVTRKANVSMIPRGDVLESAMQDLRSKRLSHNMKSIETVIIPEKAAILRRLANELRLSGSLARAIETFRRALVIDPRDGWLLFEFARCMQSVAGVERDGRLERKAMAIMRLAERRAGNDGELLSRLAENYYQAGDWRRAEQLFQKCIENVGETFRSLRGLAEIALREGKIAHVIHNFEAANRIAGTASLRRWTQAEVEYFSRLNADEDYMDLEVSRVNLLDWLTRAQSTTSRITLFGLPLILTGILFSEVTVANIGWAVSGVALIFKLVFIVIYKMTEPRIPADIVNNQ